MVKWVGFSYILEEVSGTGEDRQGDVCHLGFGHEQLGGMSVAERKTVEEPDGGEVGKSKSLLD